MIDIFVLTKDTDIIDGFRKQHPQIKTIETHERTITRDILTQILSRTLTKYFYVVLDGNIETIDFDFDFTPEAWESEYVHIWETSTNIRLFNRFSVEKQVDLYTDESLATGSIKLKQHTNNVQKTAKTDVIYLSYNEPYADENFEKLKKRVPWAKRVHGVKGIFEAHKAAAEIAHTTMMYVVDADAMLTDDFTFDYVAPESDRKFVHVWQSRNPINGLVYGYGGVKLFPTKLLREAGHWNIDFTTSVADGFKSMDSVSNIAAFNCDDFNTWKSAFRECAKLAAGTIKNSDSETNMRLHVWCTISNDAPYSSLALEGAKAGRAFGEEHHGNYSKLNLINDFKWLEDEFYSRHIDTGRLERCRKAYFEFLGWNKFTKQCN